MRNKLIISSAIFSVLFLLVFPLAVSADGRNDGGRGHVRTGVRTVVVPGYYTHPYWGWRDPFYYGYGPYPYYVDTRGRIKFENALDTDQVFVDGAFAGIVDDVGTLRLEPGKYNIKVVRQGRTLVNRDLFVVTGKKIEIDLAGVR